mgnify:CR=1 FL=1
MRVNDLWNFIPRRRPSYMALYSSMCCLSLDVQNHTKNDLRTVRKTDSKHQMNVNWTRKHKL